MILINMPNNFQTINPYEMNINKNKQGLTVV